MRLTLRTLLAYLDDILKPADAKDIGEQLAASPKGAELAEKIREVVRKRRLTGLDVADTRTADANASAEYLDNSLPAPQVAELEQRAMASDDLLAEVAACHQILALVLGEPVNVPPGLRERAYGLGAVAGMAEPPAPLEVGGRDVIARATRGDPGRRAYSTGGGRTGLLD